MGYQVYWANGRWQGYCVPAYCDYPGCREEIDRGMGYQHSEDNCTAPEVLVCEKHTYTDIESFEIEEKEHPDWMRHLLTDSTWKEWRDENPKIVEEYRKAIGELNERLD